MRISLLTTPLLGLGEKGCTRTRTHTRTQTTYYVSQSALAKDALHLSIQNAKTILDQLGGNVLLERPRSVHDPADCPVVLKEPATEGQDRREGSRERGGRERGG